MGINVTCAPVLDVPQPDAHDVIGDRAFATDPERAAAFGRACLDGLHLAGVERVIKHIPGTAERKAILTRACRGLPPATTICSGIASPLPHWQMRPWR